MKVLDLSAGAGEMRQILATGLVWLREFEYLTINPPEEGEEVSERPDRVRVWWRSTPGASRPRLEAEVKSVDLFHDATPVGGRGNKRGMCYVRLELNLPNGSLEGA